MSIFAWFAIGGIAVTLLAIITATLLVLMSLMTLVIDGIAIARLRRDFPRARALPTAPTAYPANGPPYPRSRGVPPCQ